MNRAIKRRENRHKEKENVFYKYNPMQMNAEIQRQLDIANEKVRKEEAKIRKDAAKEVVDMMIAVFALSLHDEVGFGNKRIERIMRKVKDTFSCIKSEHVSYNEIQEELKRLKINF